MLSEPIRVLKPDDMQRIHEAALDILETTGMRIESEKALSLLERAGCRVDEGRWAVRFPRQVVQTSVDRMRQGYANPNRKPDRMAVRYSHVRFRREPHGIHPDFTASAGGFCVFLLDTEGRRRKATLRDVRRGIHLVNQLEGIDYTGLPVSDQDTPVPLRPVRMAAELATYSRKFGGVETFRKEDIPYLVEIATIVKGSLERLRSEPILVGYAEARSPLCLDRDMAEIFIEYIERGFPQTLDTMPCGGGTAPATAAGILALGAAETLGGVALAHAVDPDAVVGADITPSYMDMQSGLFRYASPERLPLLIARIQLISDYYGCPSGVHGGKTDSCRVNVQTGIEKAATIIVPVLAGAVGIGTLGHVENAVTFCPQQLVIDHAIVQAVRRMLRPMEISPETLAVDLIAAVGAGGQFLEQEHTLRHFREELFLSPLFERVGWSAVPETGGMEQQALEQARELTATDPEPVLDDARRRAVESVVRAAERRFLEN